MRQTQYGSRSHYADCVSIPLTLADTEAQLATLQWLGDAIKQERQVLERTLDHYATLPTTTDIC